MPRHKEREHEWVAPGDAAKLMSERAGYIVTPDDLKQMRRKSKFQFTKPITHNLVMYDKEEIETVAPPKKRNPVKLASVEVEEK